MAALERVHAISHHLSEHRLTVLANVLAGLSRMAFGVRLPPTVELGAGSYFSAGGLGTVVHRHAKIGRDCVISAGVTIGARRGTDDVPVIDDGCFIGAGARILGDVHVGPRSVIGANAVVIADVPPDSVAAGVPAHVIEHDEPSHHLLSVLEA
jgi:serine O-acetyltransferase